jgi:hypothetical protein
MRFELWNQQSTHQLRSNQRTTGSPAAHTPRPQLAHSIREGTAGGDEPVNPRPAVALNHSTSQTQMSGTAQDSRLWRPTDW